MYQFRGAFIFIMMYIPILDHGWWKNISMRIFLKCIHRWRHKDRRKYRYYQHHCTRYMHIYDFILKELLKLVLCRDGAIWSWSPIISSQITIMGWMWLIFSWIWWSWLIVAHNFCEWSLWLPYFLHFHFFQKRKKNHTYENRSKLHSAKQMLQMI